MLIHGVFRALSPPGAAGRLTVLILHRVLERPDPLQPDVADAAHFSRVCAWLAQAMNVLPADEAVRRLRAGTLPARAAAITFDDGYADNHDVALPVLRRHGLNATFFVATGYLGSGRMFNDSVLETLRRATAPVLDLRQTCLGNLGQLPLRSMAERVAAVHAVLATVRHHGVAEREAFCTELQQRAQVGPLPQNLMMSPEQVRALHLAGMGVGSHTVSHPMLARLDDTQALAELRHSRETLQTLTGGEVSLFAYPNGRPGSDYTAHTAALVAQAGYAAAFTTAWGAARPDSDPFQLPRFMPWDRTRARFLLRLALNLRAPRESTAPPQDLAPTELRA